MIHTFIYLRSHVRVPTLIFVANTYFTIRRIINMYIYAYNRYRRQSLIGSIHEIFSLNLLINFRHEEHRSRRRACITYVILYLWIL